MANFDDMKLAVEAPSGSFVSAVVEGLIEVHAGLRVLKRK